VNTVRIIVPLIGIAAALNAQYGISSVAGGGPRVGMQATSAYLSMVSAVAWSPDGSYWVSSSLMRTVIRITADGIIYTVLGGAAPYPYPTGDGELATSSLVKFGAPSALAVDRGSNLFIVDGASRVRKLDIITGIISTVAGNGGFSNGIVSGVPATSTSVYATNLATDFLGNLFIVDLNCVRKVAVGTGIITTVAGTGTAGFAGDGGPATGARLSNPSSVAVDAAGDLYIADSGNYRVRKVSASTGVISTIAGNGTIANTGDGGPATSAALIGQTITLDGSGNLFVGAGADPTGWIRKVSLSSGLITSIPIPLYKGPGLASDSAGNLLYGQLSSFTKFNALTQATYTVAGNGNSEPTFLGNNGLATVALLRTPVGLALSPSGDIYVGDGENSGFLRMISAATGIITTVVGAGTAANAGDGGLAANAGIGGYVLTPPSATALMPIAYAPSGDIFIVDTGVSNIQNVGFGSYRIRRISAQSGIINTFAGGGTRVGGAADGGPALSADLTGTTDVYADSTDVYIADGSGNIRKINQAIGTITTVAANTNARSIDRDAAGNFYFTSGDSVAKYTASTGIVTTIAGSFRNCTACDPSVFGTYTGVQLGDGGPARNARLNAPQSVKVDRSGNLYIADSGNHRIRFISAATGIISTLAGTNSLGCSGDQGTAADALLTTPSRVVLDPAGKVYIADSGCGQIFKLTPFAGYLDRVDCQGISGWAADRSRPNEPLQLHIYDRSDRLYVIIAEQLRTDVGSYLGDNGLHGFNVPLASYLYDGNSHYLRVLYGTATGSIGAPATTIDLPGSPVLLTCGYSLTGYIDKASCAGITGWAASRTQPNVSISVSLWDGTQQIASTIANGLRSDVGSYLGDDGRHAFTLSLPAAYLDGIPHSLQVHYANSTSNQVPGSPVSLTCGAAPRLAGWLDHAGCDGLSGWAADRNRPNQTISVDVVEGTSILATVLATASRPDVGAEIGDTGLHGFSVATPAALKDGRVHAVQVRYSGTTQSLSNSPQNLQCTGGSAYVGYVDVLSCSAISGWAADRSSLNTSVNVDLYDGSTLMGTVTATGSRPDVGAYLNDNGLHGFGFTPPVSLKDGLPHAITVRIGTTVIGSSSALTCHP